MLVRLKVNEDRLAHRSTGRPEDLDEEVAATRIQAIYRGRRTRSRCEVRRANAGVRSADQKLTQTADTATSHRRRPLPVSSASPTPQTIVSGGGEDTRAHGASQGVEAVSGGSAASSQPRRPSPPNNPYGNGQSDSVLAKSSSGIPDFDAVINDLEERPTKVPRHIQRWRIRLYILFEEPRSSWGAQILSILLLCLIITSIVCFMIETMPELKHVPKDVWLVIEIICTAAFTVEYVTRLLVCGVAGISHWHFIKNTMNVFDLLAILPFYIWVAMRSFSLAKALGVLRTVRLVRLFRIFKLGRYSVGLQLMGEALRNSSQALWVLSFFLCIGILLFSSAVYYIEKMSCPDVEDLMAQKHLIEPDGNFTEWDRYVADCRVSKDGLHITHGLCCDKYGSPLDFTSIVEAFWWSTVTMTTVGFGEVYPRTELGRLVATATMLSGILLIALPVAIIGRKFQEVYEKKEHADHYGGADIDERATPYERQPLAATQTAPTPQADQGPTLYEMSRRLRLMKHPDANMSQSAMELAEELDEAGDLQKEIKSMQSEEKARQAEVVEIFDDVLRRFTELLDSGKENNKMAKTIGRGALGKTKGITGLVVSAVKKKSAETEATTSKSEVEVNAAPLPPPPLEAPAEGILPGSPPGMVDSP